jgi:hypothetical protein
MKTKTIGCDDNLTCLLIGVSPVLGPLRNLWQECEDCVGATARGSEDPPRQEHGHLRGQVSQGTAPKARDGVIICSEGKYIGIARMS